jgi:TonB-linked SusC/RagA family outer membrane protein
MSSPQHRLLSAFVLLCLPAAASAQAIITGVVRGPSAAPVAGARVVARELAPPAGTNAAGVYAIVTNAAGVYRLVIPAERAQSEVTLRVSYIGFQPRSQRITLRPGTQTVDITFTDEARALEGVVVTALGVAREERSLGYAVQRVSGTEVTQAPVPNVIDALAGKTAGVTITSSGGRPGASSRIVLRGESSFLGNTQPLFVIDGVPVSNDVDPNVSGAFNLDRGQMTSRAVDLDPNSIEDVSVLKGAAATALYGSRAANGAILITTKRGAGRTAVSVASRISSDEPILGEYQETYLAGQNGFYSNGLPLARGGYVQTGYPGTNPVTLLSWGPDRNSVDPTVLSALGVSSIPTFDPRRDYYTTGRLLETSVNVSGQIPSGSFFLGGTRTHQTGIIPGSGFGRTSLTANITTSVGSVLTSATNVMFSKSANSYLDDGWFGPQRWLSLAPISYNSRAPFFTDGTPISSGADAFWITGNQAYGSDVNRLIAGQTLTLSLPRSLALADRLGMDTYTDQRSFYTNQQPWVLTPTGSMWDQKVVRTNLNNDLTLSLSEIDLRPGLTLSGLIGNNVSMFDVRSGYLGGSEINVPGFYNIANFNRVTASQNLTRQRLIGAYGQASLGYHNYLYLQGSARNDWSSTLPTNANSYFYPSVSVGYVFTDALGWQNAILDYGKLRASWARVGNSAPPYRLSTGYGQTSFTDFPNSVDAISFRVPFNGVNGYTLSASLGNPALKPELTTERELGLELRLLKGRASAEMTAYDKTTRDQIFAVPSSAATGYTSILRNAGDLRNRGVEFTLSGTPIQTSAVTWNVRANWAKNRSSVVELAPGVTNIYLAGYSYPQIRIMKDEGYGVIWGFAYERNAAGEVLVGNNGMPIPSRSLSSIGNIQPDWIGNLQSGVTYRGISLSGLVDIRHGGDILNFEKWYTVPQGTAKVTEQRNDMYVYPGVNATTGQPNTVAVRRDRAYYTAWATAVQENLVEDGSYVKLREATLAWQVPPRLLGHAAMQSLQLYFTGHNLMMDTPFTSGDPEGNTVGSDNAGGTALHFFNTPTTRSYTFGLRANF